MKKIILAIMFIFLIDSVYAIDPSYDFDSDSVTLNFDSNENYNLSNMSTRLISNRTEEVLVLTPQNYVIWDKLEDTDFTDWKVNTNLVRSGNDSAYDNYSAYLGNSFNSADEDLKLGGFGTTPTPIFRIIIVNFKEQGGSSGGEFMFGAHVRNNPPLDQYGIMSLGFDGLSVAPNEYIYRIGTGAQTGTGINRDSDWHKLIISTRYTSALFPEDEVIWQNIYLDGIKVREETGDGNSGLANFFRNFGAVAYDSFFNHYIYIDELIMSKSSNVFNSGSAEIELDFEEKQIESFDSVNISDEIDSGMWRGNITYDFAHSTNGGSTYNSYQTLNDTNLQGLDLSGDGQDVLKIRILHTPDENYRNNVFIPKSDKVVINFTEKSEEEDFIEYFLPFTLLAGVFIYSMKKRE